MIHVRKYVAVAATITCFSFSTFFLNCDSATTANNDTKVIEILSPSEGSLYNNYDNIIVITKFDPTKVGVDLRRKFSVDSGKTFTEMHYDKIEGRTEEAAGVEYSYEVVRWKLSEDSVKNVRAQIRIESYGDETVFDKIQVQID